VINITKIRILIFVIIAAFCGYAVKFYFLKPQSNILFLTPALLSENFKNIPAVKPRYYVVFDQSCEQTYSPYETGYSGMSGLTLALKKSGVSVSLNSIPLEKFLENYSGKGKILVLGPAINRRYGKKEIDALEKFLKSGGGILAIVEHQDLYGNITFQNDFIKKFGIAALNDATIAVGNNFREKQWAYCGCGVWNIDNIELYYPAPLKIDSKCRKLLEMYNPENPKLNITAALNDSNNGKLAVLGDAEILWNMKEPIGINNINNKLFLLKLFDYLSSSEEKYEITVTDFKPAAGSTKKALIDGSSYGLIPDSSPCGIDYFAAALNYAGFKIDITFDTNADYSRYDLVINAMPLDSNINPDIRASKRILIAGDGQTDIINDTMLQIILSRYFKINYRKELYVSALNKISAYFDLRFAGSTLISNEPTGFFVKAKLNNSGEDFLLRRSDVISGVDSELPDGYKVLVYASDDCRITDNFTPFNNFKKTEPKQNFFKSVFNSRKKPVAIISKKVIALADIEMITNQFFFTKEGQYVFNEICSGN